MFPSDGQKPVQVWVSQSCDRGLQPCHRFPAAGGTAQASPLTPHSHWLQGRARPPSTGQRGRHSQEIHPSRRQSEEALSSRLPHPKLRGTTEVPHIPPARWASPPEPRRHPHDRATQTSKHLPQAKSLLHAAPRRDGSTGLHKAAPQVTGSSRERRRAAGRGSRLLRDRGAQGSGTEQPRGPSPAARPQQGRASGKRSSAAGGPRGGRRGLPGRFQARSRAAKETPPLQPRT